MPVIQIEETAVFNERHKIKYQLKAVLAVKSVMDQAGRFNDSDFYVITKDEQNASVYDFKDIMTLRQVHSLYYERWYC